MINISNSISKNNPPWLLGEAARPAPSARPTVPAGAAVTKRASTGSLGARLRHALVVTAAVPLSWLAAVPRRLGDRLFAMNDTEACWRTWQITKTRGGLGRCYRDPRFDALAECAKCRGAGVNADAPCGPCLGTGRITVGEVS